MIIRKLVPDEISRVIKLLQKSLGESLLKKTTEIWNFKHVSNPFGESYVLLAEEEQTLVGVRAFMQWRWQMKDTIWVAYRAVDTATHPEHQGKGIFKRLTLQALEDVQRLNESFVFNTPNEKSKPGYLKMGWKEVGKIKVSLIPTFLYFPYIFFKLKTEWNTICLKELENICEIHNEKLKAKGVLFTPKSAEYLKWRYEENPMQNYQVITSSEWYVAMYVKKHRFFNELRVVEVIGDLKKHKKEIQKAIFQKALKNKSLIISSSKKNLFRMSIYGGYGPMLTFKSLTNSEQFVTSALDINTWEYSLGDLELF